MLHKNPKLISNETLSLIRELQTFPELKEFYLVGGTSLALQIGHRNSIDIDLFTPNEFDTVELKNFLNGKFNITTDVEFKNTLLCRINNIKVDFIRHHYPYVKPPLYVEGIHFLSKEDISAMKLQAISQSGKRLKDFIDIYFLLEYFSLKSMLDFFTVKYPQTNPLIPLRAINYFEDIDMDSDPPKLLTPLPFNKIRNRIQTATAHSQIIFEKGK